MSTSGGIVAGGGVITVVSAVLQETITVPMGTVKVLNDPGNDMSVTLISGKKYVAMGQIVSNSQGGMWFYRPTTGSTAGQNVAIACDGGNDIGNFGFPLAGEPFTVGAVTQYDLVCDATDSINNETAFPAYPFGDATYPGISIINFVQLD